MHPKSRRGKRRTLTRKEGYSTGGGFFCTLVVTLQPGNEGRVSARKPHGTPGHTQGLGSTAWKFCATLNHDCLSSHKCLNKHELKRVEHLMLIGLAATICCVRPCSCYHLPNLHVKARLITPILTCCGSHSDFSFLNKRRPSTRVQKA